MKWVLSGFAALLLLAVVLIISLPATQITSRIPQWVPGLQVSDVAGRLWQGSGTVHYQGIYLGEASWRIAMLPMIWQELDAQITLEGPEYQGKGGLRLSEAALQLQDFTYRLPAQVLVQMQAFGDGTVGGEVLGNIQNLAFHFDQGVQQLGMQARWEDASWQSGGEYAVPLSDVELLVIDGSPPTGTIRDMGGPLAVRGSVRFSGFTVATQVDLSARGNDARIAGALNWIGQPQADGSRRLEITSEITL